MARLMACWGRQKGEGAQGSDNGDGLEGAQRGSRPEAGGSVGSSLGGERAMGWRRWGLLQSVTAGLGRIFEGLVVVEDAAAQVSAGLRCVGSGFGIVGV